MIHLEELLVLKNTSFRYYQISMLLERVNAHGVAPPASIPRIPVRHSFVTFSDRLRWKVLISPARPSNRSYAENVCGVLYKGNRAHRGHACETCGTHPQTHSHQEAPWSSSSLRNASVGNWTTNSWPRYWVPWSPSHLL